MPLSVETMAKVRKAFEQKYGSSGAPAFLATAPGRINIIGEHTDYNHGFVFPCGLGNHMYFAFRPRSDTTIRVHALDLNESGRVDLSSFQDGADPKQESSRIPRFMHFIVGPGLELRKHVAKGQVMRGFDAVVSSTIPLGGGVSSSSALCVVAAKAFEASNNPAFGGALSVTAQQLLEAICRGEWRWSGVNGGIMDQYTSINAKEGCCFVLDCRTSQMHPGFTQIPFPKNLAIIIANTNVKHDLVGTPYNDRRRSCEAAAKVVQTMFPQKKITHLRDVTLTMLEVARGKLNQEAYQRALHGVTEDGRTLLCAEAIKQGNLEVVGTLVKQSHASLRDVYEVSCKELDIMCDIANELPGCYGARMMGGGFGGCCIILAAAEAAKGIVAKLHSEYARQSGRQPSISIQTPGPGARVQALATA